MVCMLLNNVPSLRAKKTKHWQLSNVKQAPAPHTSLCIQLTCCLNTACTISLLMEIQQRYSTLTNTTLKHARFCSAGGLPVCWKIIIMLNRFNLNDLINTLTKQYFSIYYVIMQIPLFLNIEVILKCCCCFLLVSQV